MVHARRIRLTRHAVEKFDVLKHYGFEIRKKLVINTALDPEHLEERGNQFFVTRIIDSKHALRVVYEDRKDYLIVITLSYKARALCRIKSGMTKTPTYLSSY